jgi:hypothetical protein
MTKTNAFDTYAAANAHGETVIDLPALAAALAPLLGGTLGAIEPGRYGRAEILMDGWAISLRHNHKKRDGITARGWFPNGGNLHYGERPKLPEANLTIAQPVERIAKALRSRLVDAGAEAVALYKGRSATRSTQREQLKAAIAELTAAFPHISVQLPADLQATSAPVHGRGGVYFSGSISFDGALSIDRIGSLKGDNAKALLALLAKA